METALEAGDVLSVWGPSPVSEVIRFCSRNFRGLESPTRVNHSAIVVSGGTVEEAVIVEARSRVKRHRLIEAYGGTKERVAVHRLRAITADQRAAVCKKAESYVGRRYGYAKLVAHAGDWGISELTGSEVHILRSLMRMDRYPICSWVVAYAYAAGGVEFGVPAYAAQPDDIWDYVQTSQLWLRVRPLVPLGVIA